MPKIDADNIIHLDRRAVDYGLMVFMKDDWLLTLEDFNDNFIPENWLEAMQDSYVTGIIAYLN